MDRRTTLQWLAAAAAWPGLQGPALAATAQAYGTDPNLVRIYRSGELWPLTFTHAQRRTAQALCSLIIPVDRHSPSAGQLQVHAFIDEWISAPYPAQQRDRTLLLQGLAWTDTEARRRYGRVFASLKAAQQRTICDPICYAPKAAPEDAEAARFFARFRDLTAGGFYTTPEGTRDLRFAGNTPSLHFAGPPPEVLKIVGVS